MTRFSIVRVSCRIVYTSSKRLTFARWEALESMGNMKII